MFSREEAAKLAEKILSYSTFPECAVSLTSSEEVNVRFANNGVTTSAYAVERSVVVSSTRDQKTGASSTTQIDEDSLRAVVKRSEELAEVAPANAEHMPPLGKQEYPPIEKFDEETARARSLLMIPHVHAIISAAQAKKLVAAGFFERSARTTATANKNGLFGFGRSSDARLSTTVRTPEGTSSGWDGQPSIRIAEINGAMLGERAIAKCLQWRKAVKLEPGKYTVVLEPNAAADLLGNLSFSFSARAAEEGRSFLSKKGGGTHISEKLFPEIITLRSDPFDPRLPALPWSADGLPNRRMTWIDKGVVQNLFYDRYWAENSGKRPTPFPSAMVLDGTGATLDELIGSVKRGLLVTHFWYIRMVNPQTLQLTGLTRDGLFLIEDGKVTAPVMNFRFNESPVRLLQNAQRLGRVQRTRGFEGGSMLAPAMVAADFTLTSVSDAV